MGFFDKLKSIITKKEKKVEEVEVEKVTSSEDIEEILKKCDERAKKFISECIKVL